MTQLQPTDEMIEAACAAAEEDGTHLWRDTGRAIAAAVLAIVERERVEPLRIALERIGQAAEQHLNTDHCSQARGLELRRKLGEATLDAADVLYGAAAPEAGAGHRAQDAREGA